MADVVQGRFVILYVKLGVDYLPIACSKDVSIEITRDLLELAPRSSVNAREYEYGRYTGKITGSGLTKIGGDGLYTIFNMATYQLAGTKALVRFSVEDPDGNLQIYECNCLIETTGVAKSSGSISTHNYSLKITGPVTLTYTAGSVPFDRVDGAGSLRDVGDGFTRETA